MDTSESRYRILGTVLKSDMQTFKGLKLINPRRLIPGNSRSADISELEIKSTEIVRMELANGFSLWLRADDLLHEFGKKSTNRGGQVAWEIVPKASTRSTAQGTRGVLGLAIKLLDIFDIDLNLEHEAAQSLCKGWENKQLGKQGEGLYYCSLKDQFELSDSKSKKLASEKPLLVFIHGTASNSQKSFGGLWKASSKVGKATREKLKEKYGEAVYAFEHRTLTESPIQNARQLVEQLPNNAKLHLITHSRGGVVGELLCLGDLSSTSPDKETINKLFAADHTIAEQLGLNPLDGKMEEERDAAYQNDRNELTKLLALLDQKQIKVERFVRVACPARGTTLASGRLDRWLSALNFLSGDGLFGDTVDFLLEVIKKRTDPRTLPGLEAMMPGSALTRLLQDPSLETNADLSIIAGDMEGGNSLWSQLKLWVTDWFYDSDHDLVVNTGSMYGGLRRPAQQARFLCDQGPEVHHFNYFNNEKTVNCLLQGLLRPDGSNGPFQVIEQAKPEEPRWRSAVQRSRSLPTPQPLAVVLPGTMGSALNVNGESIWLNYFTLLKGGLKKLRVEAANVQPIDLLGDFYGPLLEFLARSHRVEVFPYDWRLSVREAAKKLTSQLEIWLPTIERNHQPVHLIAHSMGGLVVRAMIADEEGSRVWQRITQLPNSRFLMLGTPNMGSYEAVRWLTGNNPTQAKLSLLDITQSVDEITNIVSGYPGLLELLPFDSQGQDFSQPSLWKKLKEQLSAKWAVPEDSVLITASETWRFLSRSVGTLDPKYVCYVAGCQDATVIDYRLVDCGGIFSANCKRFEFLATYQGDGTVSWKSGVIPGIKAWYLDDAAHDDLCKKYRAFPAYLDLLMSGATNRLPDSPPSLSRAMRGEPDIFVLPSTPPTDGMPDEASLRSFSFGIYRPLKEDGADGRLPTIQVSIRHGDLAYAKHAVLVGHYRGDGIFSAEKSLDNRLDHDLSNRIRLGLYPGEIGTHALFFNKDANRKPGGAIVIGLGQVGELTPSLLILGVRDALLQYAMRVAQWPAKDERFGDKGKTRSVAITSLLVGTGAGGTAVRDSIEAILRGTIAANAKLVEAELDDKVLIDTLEFLELYEDVAIAAADALESILTDGQLALQVSWQDRTIQEGQGGWSRLNRNEMGDWWHRLEITQIEETGMLRFVSTTNRARAEETLATGQLRLAEGFIQQASQSSNANSEVAKTLFEMLLPNRLKELAPQQEGVVLIVDEVSARYPWELLEDRWSQSDRPPAVNAGLIRQLKTSKFRSYPAHSSQSNALVIGNPDLSNWDKFSDLPGARDEAQAVAKLLTAGGYLTDDYIDEEAHHIMSGLHKNAWRILHLAGHGEHEFVLESAESNRIDTPNSARSTERKVISGMVIGKNTFLTPGDIEQMRWVPELVFINCCHLGKTLGTGNKKYGLLAANLAVQFIRMGVKAVVAAGWAVDDAAGKVFAESFYTHMLKGQAFGDAVRAAREETWLRYNNTNTWGAYQCYGDPSYRLRNIAGDQAKSDIKPYHTAAELITDLNNDTAGIRMQVADPRESEISFNDVKQKIDQRLAAIPKTNQQDWLARAEVAAAIGFAYGEIKAWEEAIIYLEKALQAEKGECTFKVIEQLTNFRVRYASEQWQQLNATDRAAKRAKFVADINKAIIDFKPLCNRAPNPERLCLMGSAYKRLAQIDTQSQLDQLLCMHDYYQQAYVMKGSNGYYAFVNMVTAAWLRKQLGGNDRHYDAQLLFVDCNKILEKAQKTNLENPDFWNSVTQADCALIKWMLQGEISEASTNQVIALYQGAIQRGASPKQIGSVKENFQFLMDLTQLLDPSIQDAIKSIHEALP